MSMYRAYTADSGLISVASTGLTPLLYIAPTSYNDLHVIAVKGSVEASGSAPTAVSNANLVLSLNAVTGTKGGGAAVTPAILGSSSLAANTVVDSGTTALTGLTQSTEKWSQAVPFSGGSWATEDWANTGEEIDLAASSLSCFYLNVPTGPGAGSGWYVRLQFRFAE